MSADKFELFGDSFAYAAEFCEFAYAEFCEAMDDGLDENNNRATAIMLRLAVASIADADQARFRRVCRKNRAKSVDYMVVFKGLLEHLAERPTGRPTDSSDGRAATPETSASQPDASVTPLPAPKAAPKVAKKSARPDLALAAARSRPA